MKLRTALLSALLCCLTASAAAQGTVDDYRRAYGVKQTFNRNNVYYSDVTPQWIADTHSFWYVRRTPEGDRYVTVNADNPKVKRPLFDHDRLAAELARATGEEVKADKLPVTRISVNKAQDSVRFDFRNHHWLFVKRGGVLTDEGVIAPLPPEKHWMVTDDEKEGAPVTSPDGRWTAFIKNFNIYVKDTKSGAERQLSIDGTLANYYSAYIRWSPDSKRVAACKIRPVAEKRYVYYVESSPTDQLQPKLHKQEYAKPGDELPFRIPCIYEVETGRATIPSIELFNSQYELSLPKWDEDSRAITFEYNQRGHQVYRVLELSAETGRVRPIVEETSDKYVNYPRYFRHDLKGGRQMIWMSERDNWNHLYLYDRAAGRAIRQITRGEWYVRDVLHVDEAAGQITFTANGVDAERTGEDPYLIRYYRINLDGSGLVCLTPEAGNHRAWFSADRRYLVDVYSSIDKAPVAVLRSAADGKVVVTLETADISKLLAAGWKAPEVFAAPGRDGKTKMWGLIVRPVDFDASKKYPVIEYIYQGPGSQYVPKSFTPYDRYMHSLAELGFIVVMVDGMGTSYRSREFENICYHNLQDAGLPDHIAWIKAAAAKYPYMDIDRVGIYGCSAGGQESLTAVLHHPEFYKACYSACGCHDNRMDKIWWNELWMGYPIGEQYKKSSNVEYAHLLSRPLMLVVGELDDNVDPASTMQVANALIKADKDFELIVIPGARHTVGEAYGERKRYDFFVRNLMAVSPPKWDEYEAK